MYIQMVTALVLQLIQCVVHLPSDKDTFEEYDSKVGEEATLTNKCAICIHISKHSDAIIAQSLSIFSLLGGSRCVDNQLI